MIGLKLAPGGMGVVTIPQIMRMAGLGRAWGAILAHSLEKSQKILIGNSQRTLGAFLGKTLEA